MRTSSVEQIILETLSKEHTHLTSHQVYEEIRPRLPAVNPSTVYRALERLANNAKISVSDMGTGSAVYELLADGMHHHLVCQKCGKVTTIGHAEIQDFFTAIQQKQERSYPLRGKTGPKPLRPRPGARSPPRANH